MRTNRNVRICVPICQPSLEAAAQASASAAAVADLVEVRLDCLESRDLLDESKLRALAQNLPVPVILTLRPKEQGGNCNLDQISRLAFWNLQKTLSCADFFDLEQDLVDTLASVKATDGLDWNRVICSYHDFKGVPPKLEEIYHHAATGPARIVKIAVHAEDLVDCISLFQLMRRASSEGKESVLIAMGTAGIVTRILGPSRGAFLTYGALNEHTSTAPGQITAEELRDLYRIDNIDPNTNIMGVVGFPITHSVSPHIHNAALAQSGINAVYIPFHVRNVSSFLTRMVHPRSCEIDWHVRGLSITAPHKSHVMDQLDWVAPAAREIGAVNTIVVDDEKLKGYNTDAGGFATPLIERVGDLRGARCAVLGAGGAASGVLWRLRQEQGDTTVFARDIKKSSPIAERFGALCLPLVDARLDGFDVVINATSLGTKGTLSDQTPVLSHQLHGARLVYDLVYNPIETRLLREAREAGCDILGGLPMLIAQAEEQFRLWTGHEPARDVMQAAAMRALERDNAAGLTSNV